MDSEGRQYPVNGSVALINDELVWQEFYCLLKSIARQARKMSVMLVLRQSEDHFRAVLILSISTLTSMAPNRTVNMCIRVQWLRPLPFTCDESGVAPRQSNSLLGWSLGKE